MTPTLGMIALLMAYLVIGGAFARSQAIRLQGIVNKVEAHVSTYSRRRHSGPWWMVTKSYANDFRFGLFVYTIGWWALLPYRITVWLIDHCLATPVTKRRAEVAELVGRRDALKVTSHRPDVIGVELDALKISISELDDKIKELTL